jgi:hypothetical protein
MRKKLLPGLVCLMFITASAQHTHELTAPKQPAAIVSGKLQIGGSSPGGGNISVNSYYIMRDSRPVIPVMGEFHYCRYPNAQWEEQLMKIKAGGVSTVSTYVFWNIHEPHEGQFDWTGDLDLHRFVKLCQKHGLDVIVRIGPFDHGEVRNGGLPDWLYAKPIDVRSNDSLYLHYAKMLFRQIARQLQGLYYKDGGPIIGIQIENEHQHAASTWALSYAGHSEYTSASYDQAFTHFQISPDDRKIATARLGDEHMMTLKRMAADCGMIVPVYTATGWGNAAVLGYEGLPVMAAYPYATWTDITKRSPYCLFTDLRRQPDYSPVRFNPQDFPSIYAEMGCGIQMGYGQRPVVDPRGVATMLLRSIGSGSNGFGYYMYHGGATPKMKGGTAFYSDGDGVLPRISYDFQAPLGENGMEKESYRRLRMLHSFLADFQDILAPMETVLPKGAENLTPEDTEQLRYCARMKDDSGFLFLINFQDHDSLRHDMDGLQMQLNLRDETLRIPGKGSFCLPKNTNAIFPFNLQMSDIRLKYATAQLLMKLNDRGSEHYIFFVPDGMKAEYLFDEATVKGKKRFCPIAGLSSTFSVKSKHGTTVYITTLTEQLAMDAVKLNGKLLITPATVLPDKDGITLLSLDNPQFSYLDYPSAQGMKWQTRRVETVEPQYEVKKHGNQLFSVAFNDAQEHPHVHEYFLDINYKADVAMAFLGGELIADDLWHGKPWTLALNRHRPLLDKEDITLRFRPLKKELEIKNIRILPQYKLKIKR